MKHFKIPDVVYESCVCGVCVNGIVATLNDRCRVGSAAYVVLRGGVVGDSLRRTIWSTRFTLWNRRAWRRTTGATGTCRPVGSPGTT